MAGGIYKITSPSGRVYIGKTSSFNRRIKQYRCVTYKAQAKLYNSVKKYGWDNHKFEIILELNPYNDEIACLAEIEYIESFGSFNSAKGMNLTSGGEAGYTLSEESRKKISAKQKGRKRTEAERSNLSKKMRGKPFLKSSIWKLSDFQSPNSHLVLDLNTGIFYGSIRAAARALSIPHRRLSHHLSGSRNYNYNIIKV